MNFADKIIKSQLELLSPIADGSSLDLVRSLQNKIGKLMHFTKRRDVVVREDREAECPRAVIVPRDEVRSGVILYLHGGGYTCGNLDYAKGFAAVLSSLCGMRTVAIEYRLAPEAPYPAALEDCYSAYCALLDEGYTSDKIILAGESAGGGLVFALTLLLRDREMSMPRGLIAISPWCDLTLSGESYTLNKDADPSITKERLRFFADCYVGAEKPQKKIGRKNKLTEENSTPEAQRVKRLPYVSPIFADLSDMPPSIIFAGGDEILLSDAVEMNKRLKEHKSQSQLIVHPKMWHAYLLYALKSSSDDMKQINDFVKRIMPRSTERKLRWMHLDNAAKIYPAAASSRWTNVFRLSATLKEEFGDIDRDVLQSALDVTVRRFPSISVRLRRGVFWYYLEEIAHAPRIMDERYCPLVHMPFDDIRSCAFRVLIYGGRIAIEFFHALTDGNGGLVFLKTLLAEYLTQKYKVVIPATDGILDRLEPPCEEEMKDCFPKHKAIVGKSRKDDNAYRVFGTPERDGFIHDTAFTMDSQELRSAAKQYGVTVTAFMTSVFIVAAVNLQNSEVTSLKKQRPVKILVPVDLRRIFGERTLRNFALYVCPGIDPRLGEYTFPEICKIVSDIMELEITEKNMSAIIHTNVKDEESIALKLTPLFLKNLVMKAVFLLVGEKKSTLSLSNLGVVKLPYEMQNYINCFDFQLSVQSTAPYNASLITYGDSARLHFTRNILEPRFEMSVYQVLRGLGIHVKAEANER